MKPPAEDDTPSEELTEAQVYFFARVAALEQAHEPFELELLLTERPDLADELHALYASYWRGRRATDCQPADALAAEAEHLYRSLADGASPGTDAVEQLCAQRPDLERQLRAQHGEHLRASAELESVQLATPTDGDAIGGLASELLEPLRSPDASVRQYFLIDTIARGGFALVEKVWDGRLRRAVARKVLPVDARPERLPALIVRRLTRFLAEAQIQSQLSHPAILSVIDLGIDERGRPYYTMPLVHGEHFGRVIERVRRGEAQASLARAVQILVQTCDAMAYAHEKGVIHRDLKPQNVMVGRFGETFVMDWGLARVVKTGSGSRERVPAPSVELSTLRADLGDQNVGAMLTQDGDVLGTPAFMAPEQAAGRITETGHLADQYSIGAMLYQLLTGHAPYTDPSSSSSAAELVDAVRRSRPTSVAELARAAPPELIAICERAMARVPAERYSSTRALGDDLRAYLEGRVVRAHATGALAELRKWVQRNRTAAAVSAAALVVILAALGGGYWLQAKGRRAAEQSNAALRDEQARSAAQVRKARWAAYRSDLKEVQARIAAGDVASEVIALLAGCDPEQRGWEWDWLDHTLDESDCVLVGHGGKYTEARFVFSPDGDLLASGSYDRTARLWQRDTGECLDVLMGHWDFIDDVVFSPDGRRLVTGSRDCTLRLWDASSGQQLAVAQLPGYAWGGAAFLSDGRIAASCSDRHIRLFDGATLEKLHDLAELPDSPTSVASAGKQLAVGDRSGLIRLWDLATLELVRDYRVAGAIGDLQFDDVGNELWGIAGGSQIVRLDTRGADVHQVEIPHLTDVSQTRARYMALNVKVGLIGLASPDGVHIVGLDGRHRTRLFGSLWDVGNLAFSPDGRQVVTSHGSGQGRLWSLDRVGAYRKLAGLTSTVRGLEFSPDSAALFASGADGKVVVHDVTRGSLPRRELDTGQGPVSLAVAADGSSFVTVRLHSGPGFLRQWDVETLALRSETTKPLSAVDVEWSHDGKLVAFATDFDAMIFHGLNAEDGVVKIGRSQNLVISSLAIAPTSDAVATLDDAGGLCVWRAADGTKLKEWRAYENDGWQIAWSADGRSIATSGRDVPWGVPTVKVFDADLGALRYQIDVARMNATPGQSIAFSPDSKRLAYPDSGRAVRLLDVASGEPVISIPVDHNVTRLAFSPDGRFLAAGDEGGAIHLWWAGPESRGARAR